MDTPYHEGVGHPDRHVIRRCGVLAAASILLAASLPPEAALAQHKIDQIRAHTVPSGGAVVFTSRELNVWARAKMPTIAPEGVREPRLELGKGAATGYAMVDFLKLRHAHGERTSWLVSKLIEGEKPVKVDARVESGHGQAAVFLQRVEIGGFAVSGSTLDFLIRTFFLPLYPNAKINEPFELADNIDHLEVTPAQARVVIKRQPDQRQRR